VRSGRGADLCGKKVVSASVICQTLLMVGARILLAVSMLRKLFPPSSSDININSTGYMADVTLFAFPSDCLCVGTKCMCPDGICVGVSILGWRRFAADRWDVFYHNGRIKIAKNGVGVSVDEASASRIVFFLFSRSYSGFAAQDPVHM